MRYFLATSLFVFGAAASCSDSDRPNIFVSNGGTNSGGKSGGKAGASGKAGNAGSGGASGKAGSGDAGNSMGEAGAGGEAAAAITPPPVVTITSPTAATNPDIGPVLIGDQAATPITVLCNAVASTEPDAQPLKADSVKIALLDSAGVQKQVHAATPTANAGEFTATFNIGAGATSDAPKNGKISFKCTASDSATPASVGSGTVSTFVDHGPNIVVVQPLSASKNALGQLLVDFSVAPAPLAAGDVQSAGADVALTINGIAQNLPAADVNGHFILTVDLADKDTFALPPTGAEVPIVISTTNRRKPEAATAVSSYPIVIDGAPPVVNISAPLENATVGQQISLKFTVVDDLTGVVPTSVYVLLNQQKHFYPGTNSQGWTRDAASNAYTYTFPITFIPDPKVQGSPSVWATDGAGNASGGASRTFYLDTTPPLVDLDPKALSVRKKENEVPVCSTPFDPLGTKAVSDLGVVRDAALFRALVWDQTNTQTDVSSYHFAGLKQDSVVIYALQSTATSSQLLKTTGLSGTKCDTVDTTSASVLSLTKITPQGAASFTASANAIPTICAAPENSSGGSAPLCSGTSDLSVVIRHLDSNGLNDPAVFGSGDLCNGNQWILPNAVATSDGWICLVAKATDNAGNVSFSRPLRICLDAADSNGSTFAGEPPCKDPIASPPPSCTDGCEPPAQVDLVTADQ
jgi:hypothetical protein